MQFPECALHEVCIPTDLRDVCSLLRDEGPQKANQTNKTNPRTRMHYIRKDINDSCQRLWHKRLATTLAKNYHVNDSGGTRNGERTGHDKT